MPGPGVGDLAPAVRSHDQYGSDFLLEDWRGHPVLLVFFAFAFTSVCHHEMIDLRDSRYLFDAAGCRMAAISTDTTFSLREFARQNSLGFTLLTDHWPHGAIGQAYGAFDSSLGCDRRMSFLIDPGGVVRWVTTTDLPQARDVGEHLEAVHYHFPG